MAYVGVFGNKIYSYLRESHKVNDSVVVHINGDRDCIQPAIIHSITPARITGFYVKLILPNLVEFTQHMQHLDSFEYYFPNETHRVVEAKVLMGLGETASLSDMEAKKEAMRDVFIAYNVEYTKEGIKTRNAFHRRF